ncbi:nucleoside triphosphate pyrophosphohydrolase [Clostridium cylindrosporum]|uniref:MazG family protein n=1 Tax=Clostridium cylindrosporum DSM 605 TaxID=1121307 RepID=A0A0J8DCS1_CLOCY|nr:nucleoside triphosphate pyrophosphohydrolase [Clostridium cylindrosporum]KMT22049.1 MazG family protein [Clostridium cylindrosporum DSM 605]
MIKIVGLGPGSSGDLTLKTLDIMKSAKKVYIRTFKHPNVEYIRNSGIEFETFDDMYDSAEDFDALYLEIATKVASEDNVVYAVPGHPLVAEKSVQHIIKICEENGKEYEIVTALSFIDAVVSAIKIDPITGLKIIDGLQLDTQEPDINVSNIVTQVYSPFIACDIKIKLMDYYDDEQEVYLIRAAGVEGLEKIEKMFLYEIDRADWVDYLTSLYIPPCTKNRKYNFNDLVSVMKTLRSEEGCPWDREQTHKSLERYLVEECYEVLDAIRKDDIDNLSEELGDVLLQVVFHSEIAREYDGFNIRDVVHGITKKMIDRHTHIFGEDKCETSGEVLSNWDKIKMKEKSQETYTQVLKDIPLSFPSLMRALKLQEKVKKVGFEFPHIEDTISKIQEEFEEVLKAHKNGNNKELEEEIGDLLFSVVNFSRFLSINPEICLTNTIEKFIKRFEYIENKVLESGKTLNEATLGEMDRLWNEAKGIKEGI